MRNIKTVIFGVSLGVVVMATVVLLFLLSQRVSARSGERQRQSPSHDVDRTRQKQREPRGFSVLAENRLVRGSTAFIAHP